MSAFRRLLLLVLLRFRLGLLRGGQGDSCCPAGPCGLSFRAFNVGLMYTRCQSRVCFQTSVTLLATHARGGASAPVRVCVGWGVLRGLADMSCGVRSIVTIFGGAARPVKT